MSSTRQSHFARSAQHCPEDGARWILIASISPRSPGPNSPSGIMAHTSSSSFSYRVANNECRFQLLALKMPDAPSPTGTIRHKGRPVIGVKRRTPHSKLKMYFNYTENESNSQEKLFISISIFCTSKHCILPSLCHAC
jgi:hypothetical protein